MACTRPPLRRASDAAPQGAGTGAVPDLSYADDLCLLATSAAGLQRLLDCAWPFLSSVGMNVSAEKLRVKQQTGVSQGTCPCFTGAVETPALSLPTTLVHSMQNLWRANLHCAVGVCHLVSGMSRDQ